MKNLSEKHNKQHDSDCDSGGGVCDNEFGVSDGSGGCEKHFRLTWQTGWLSRNFLFFLFLPNFDSELMEIVSDLCDSFNKTSCKALLWS